MAKPWHRWPRSSDRHYPRKRKEIQMIRASITRTQGAREAPCSCEPSCGFIHWEPDGTLTLDISIAGPKDRVDELTAGFLDRLYEATNTAGT